MYENHAIRENQRMREWFADRTGLDPDVLLSTHMTKIDDMLGLTQPCVCGNCGNVIRGDGPPGTTETDHVHKSRTGTVWNVSDHCVECGGSGKHLRGCRLGSMLD